MKIRAVKKLNIIIYMSLMMGCATPPPQQTPATPRAQSLPSADIVLNFDIEIPEDLELYVDGVKEGDVRKGVRSYALNFNMNPLLSSRAYTLDLISRKNKKMRWSFVIPPNAYSKSSGKDYNLTLRIPIENNLVVAPKRSTHEKFVLAGDEVRLVSSQPTVNSSKLTNNNIVRPEEIFWFVMPDITQNLENHSTYIYTNFNDTESNVWDYLRVYLDKIIQENISDNFWFENFTPGVSTVTADQMLDKIDGLTYIGTGASVTWIPKNEAPMRIFALSKYTQGIWGLQMINVDVRDLRPAVWLIPKNLSPALSESVLSRINMLNNHIANVGVLNSTGKLIANLLHEILYTGSESTENITWQIFLDPYFLTSKPIRKLVLEVNNNNYEIENINIKRTAIVSTPNPGAGIHTAKVSILDESGILQENELTIRIDENQIVNAEPEFDVLIDRAISSKTLFRFALSRWSDQASSHMDPNIDVIAIRPTGSLPESLKNLFDFKLVGALLDRGFKIAERNALWLTPLSDEKAFQLRNALAASAIDVLGEGADLENLQTVLQNLPGKSIGNVSSIFSYNINRSAVNWIRFGPVVFRTAEIRGWVRLHDIHSYEIKSQHEINSYHSDVSVLLNLPPGKDPNVIDVYQDNMLLNPVSPTLKIGIEEKTNNINPANDDQIIPSSGHSHQSESANPISEVLPPTPSIRINRTRNNPITPPISVF